MNPISSSFPRRGARIRTKNTQQIEREKKTKPRADCKLAQKYIEQKLYDA